MRKVIVVGAGASGLMAAITAAEGGASVTILEAMDKPGKKILVTGNGRCNITNTDFHRQDIYRSETPDQIQEVLKQFNHEDTIRFFQKMGLMLHEKNKGIYPITDQSSSVLESLLIEGRRLGVKVKCTEKVSSLYREGEIWKVKTGSWTYECDSVIISCGSCCYPLTGSDGSGYSITKKLGMKQVEEFPALVPLLVREKWCKKLSGVRSNASVLLKISEEDKIIASYTERGEVQWTDYGVSGIVIFQISRYAVKALRNNQKAELQIDLFPDYSEEALYQFIMQQKSGKKIGEILTGILPKKVIPVVLELVHLKSEEKAEKIDERQYTRLVKTVKCLKLHVQGSKGYDQAQVCAGGVSFHEVNPKTLESLKHPGLYVTGELLDVDGICGGYNLQWAWSSGYVAGKACAEKIND